MHRFCKKFQGKGPLEGVVILLWAFDTASKDSSWVVLVPNVIAVLCEHCNEHYGTAKLLVS